jgi:hypothetical protein
MSRFTKVVAAFGAGSVLLFSVGWQLAKAQTPAQMEYERQQREYRQQQEQQRQDQQRLQQLQNDNARRQQEESSRFMRGTAPGSGTPQLPSTQGASPSTSAGAGRSSAAQSICNAKPVRAGERNPLMGQWRYVGLQDGRGDLMSEIQAAASAALCPAYGAGFEFRAKSMIVIGRGYEMPANYGRDGDVWLVCAPDSHLLHFRVAAPNRLHMVDPVCAYERAGTAAITPPLAPSSAATVAAREMPAKGTLRMNSYYVCNGERVAVLRCRSEADDAYCSVQYPDRKSAATGGVTPELAERRGELVKKLQGCQQQKS